VLKFENGDKIETTDTIRQIAAALEAKTIVAATS
jgi:hypothetical protein